MMCDKIMMKYRKEIYTIFLLLFLAKNAHSRQIQDQTENNIKTTTIEESGSQKPQTSNTPTENTLNPLNTPTEEALKIQKEITEIQKDIIRIQEKISTIDEELNKSSSIQKYAEEEEQRLNKENNNNQNEMQNLISKQKEIARKINNKQDKISALEFNIENTKDTIDKSEKEEPRVYFPAARRRKVYRYFYSKIHHKKPFESYHSNNFETMIRPLHEYRIGIILLDTIKGFGHVQENTSDFEIVIKGIGYMVSQDCPGLICGVARPEA